MFLVCFVGLAVIAFRYSDVLDNMGKHQLIFRESFSLMYSVAVLIYLQKILSSIDLHNILPLDLKKPEMQPMQLTNHEVEELSQEPEELATDQDQAVANKPAVAEKVEEPEKMEDQKEVGHEEVKEEAEEEDDEDDDDIPVENLAKPRNDGPIKEQKTVGNRVPLIVGWNKFHHRKLSYIFNRLNQCEYKCSFSDERSMANDADVLVIHAGTIKSRKDIPVRRKPNQKLLLFMRESPAREWQGFYHLWDKIFMSTFDITMTYLQKSDYWERYYTMDEIKEDDDPKWREEQLTRSVARKVNSSFYLVSHCGALSGRDEVVDELNKYHKVNKFGKCGEPCDLQCEADLIKSSFFYFALENSVCPDYITEKFYRFKKLIVPITFKRSLLTGIVPPDSFIAIDDFCSVEKLGKYLNWLMRNPEEYKMYFNWTRKYRKDYRMSDSMCDLCKDLHFNTVQTRNYSDYRTIKSYMPRSSCTSGFGYKMLRTGRCDNFEESENPLLKFYTED